MAPPALRRASYTSAVALTATGVERLVPPQVTHAFRPSRIVLRVVSPEENAPSATTSTPGVALAPGPRLDHTITSSSVTWLMRSTESQPVPPNWVDAPTLIAAAGLGGVTVPKPGAPLPVENSGVVRWLLWMTSASWLAASQPSLSTLDEPYELDVTSMPRRVDRK